jgi:hypothetical protein
MARVWPASRRCRDPFPQTLHPPLPPFHIQNHLLDLYFTYVHPAFPVIHESAFLAEYESRYRVFEKAMHFLLAHAISRKLQ